MSVDPITKKKPHTKCGRCGARMPKAIALFDDVAYCRQCYSNYFVPMKCPECGGRVLQPEGTKPLVCKSCKIASRKCIRCAKQVLRAGRLINGEPVCPSCVWYFRTPQPCPRCGRMSKRLARNRKLGLEEPVCEHCRRSDNRTCAHCGKYRSVAAYDHEGRPICQLCIDTNGIFVCPQCRKLGKRHSKSKCILCYWRDVGGSRLKAIEEKISQEWVARELRLFFGQQSTYNPKRAARMAHRYGEFFIAIDRHIDSPENLTLQRLSECFYDQGIHKNRQVLSFLHERGFLTHQEISQWSDALQLMRHRRILDRASASSYHDILIEYYKFMHKTVVSNRKMNWVEGNERPKPRTVSSNLSAAERFLDFACIGSVADLRALDQDVMERFLHQHPGTRDAIRPFIRYLNRVVRIFHHLSIPTLKKGIAPGLLLDEKRTSELLSRWLNANGTDTRDALLGLLMLLYCQKPASLIKVRLSEIFWGDDGGATLNVCGKAIVVEQEVGAVLQRYLDHRHKIYSGYNVAKNPFLFPGRLAGSHLAPTAITSMLQRKFAVTSPQLFATAANNAFADGIPSPKALVAATGIALPTAMKYFYAQNPRQANYVYEHLAGE